MLSETAWVLGSGGGESILPHPRHGSFLLTGWAPARAVPAQQPAKAVVALQHLLAQLLPSFHPVKAHSRSVIHSAQRGGPARHGLP